MTKKPDAIAYLLRRALEGDRAALEKALDLIARRDAREEQHILSCETLSMPDVRLLADWCERQMEAQKRQNTATPDVTSDSSR